MKSDAPVIKNKLIQYIPILFVFGIIAVFIYNIVSHGVIEHPGKTVYKTQCAQCHGEEGEGIKVLVPPLANADYLINNFDSVPCWLKNGLSHPIVVNGKTYDQPMYPTGIDDIQTANVINYISKELLHTDRQVNSTWVKEKLKDCK